MLETNRLAAEEYSALSAVAMEELKRDVAIANGGMVFS